MESTEIAKLFDALCQEPRGNCFYFEMNLNTFTYISLKKEYKFRFSGVDMEARSFISAPSNGNIIYKAFKYQKEFFGSIWFSYYTSPPYSKASDKDDGFIVFGNKSLPDGKVILRRFLNIRSK
jgi:hypothetical protein